MQIQIFQLNWLFLEVKIEMWMIFIYHIDCSKIKEFKEVRINILKIYRYLKLSLFYKSSPESNKDYDLFSVL